MGFTTGFTGGVTLTLGLAYLTVLAHERNRRAQAEALRSQSRVLNSLFDPISLPPPQSRAELAREERSTLVEAAKDRWNEEVESAVRWVQRTDWNEVREGMEGAIARLMGTGLQKSREGIQEIENTAGPKVQEAVDRSKAAAKEQARRLSDSTMEQLDYASAKAAETKDVAIAQAGGTIADARSSAHGAVDSIRQSGGTVDAARGALRGAVSAGIEKGKEAIGKAQVAVGLATKKAESTGQSAVEKVLHERYEQPRYLATTVEEALEERYKPIDKRDNTVLRGL